MKELVKRAQNGDKDAFISLIESTKAEMYKVALGILKNDSDAADAIQDTILSCYENLRSLRNPAVFKTWMMKILINHCRKIYNVRKTILFLDEAQEHQSQLQNHIEDSFLTENQDFLKLLNQIEEKYRIVLLLYYSEEFSIREIGTILGLNENTVKTRLARGRGLYKKLYMKEQTNSEFTPEQRRYCL